MCVGGNLELFPVIVGVGDKPVANVDRFVSGVIKFNGVEDRNISMRENLIDKNGGRWFGTC